MKAAFFLALALFAGLPGSSGADEMKFVTEPFRPFAYDEAGHAAGPMAEIVAAACAALHKSCTQVVLPWRRALDGAEAGRFQGIYSLLDLPQRREKFYMSQPLVQTAYAFVARAGTTWQYTGAESLRDKLVLAYGPSGTSMLAANLIKDSRGAELSIAIGNDIVLQQIAAAQDRPNLIGLINRDVAAALIEQLDISGLRFAGDAQASTYAIGLSRAAVSAKEATSFDAALSDLKASGTIKAILTRHGLRAAD